MKFVSLSSGSSGNCEYIEHDGTRILIDAGLSAKKISEHLQSIGVDAMSIDAIFVTHEHIDHIKGLGAFSNKYGAKVFSNEPTMKAILKKQKTLKAKNLYVFENERAVNFKNLSINPIPTFHDCESGCGFVVEGDKKISIFTDSGYITEKTMQHMNGSHLFFMESNHDHEMLMHGSYTWQHKKRIMSTHGHLSNEMAGKILNKLIKGVGEKIVLAHLSEENNAPEVALSGVKREIKNIFSKNYNILVAPRLSPTEVFDLR